jgi:hypothetical protein
MGSKAGDPMSYDLTAGDLTSPLLFLESRLKTGDGKYGNNDINQELKLEMINMETIREIKN